MQDIWVRRRQSLLEAELGRELVALSVEQGTCLGFNETAADLWKQLEQPARKRDLVERMLGRYEVDADTCSAEIDELLARLVSLGLIELEARPV